MPKGKISDINLLKKSEYSSIINILNFCKYYKDKKDSETKECWLSFRQLYFALKSLISSSISRLKPEAIIFPS